MLFCHNTPFEGGKQGVFLDLYTQVIFSQMVLMHTCTPQHMIMHEFDTWQLDARKNWLTAQRAHSMCLLSLLCAQLSE